MILFQRALVRLSFLPERVSSVLTSTWLLFDSPRVPQSSSSWRERIAPARYALRRSSTTCTRSKHSQDHRGAVRKHGPKPIQQWQIPVPLPQSTLQLRDRPVNRICSIVPCPHACCRCFDSE